MTTASAINSIVDGIITKIQENSSALGDPIRINEWDEHPAYPAERGELPSIYILPFVDGKDKISWTMGNTNLEHTFPVTVVGYYKFDDVETSLRIVRDYGCNLLDLFVGYTCASKIGIGEVYEASMEGGYWIPSGGAFVVHIFIVTLWIRVIT